jgi:hypothetical protein
MDCLSQEVSGREKGWTGQSMVVAVQGRDERDCG